MTNARKPWLRALAYFRPDLPRVGAAFVLLLASIACNVLKPWPLALIVDCVLGGKPLPRFLGHLALWPKPAVIALLSGAIFVLHALQAAFAAVQNYVVIQAGLAGLRRVRGSVFEALQRLSLRFLQNANAGDLIYRASWDSYAFQTLFQQGLMTVVAASLSLVFMVAIMARINVPLTLIALALAPMLVFAIRFFGRTMRDRATLAQQADSQVTSLVQQCLAALPLIQSDNREPIEMANFQVRSAAAQTRRLAQHGSELIYGLAIALAFGLGTMATTWIGASETLAGRMTVGELFVFLSYLAQLYEPLNQLSHAGTTLSAATAGARRVFELLDTPPEVLDPPNPAPFKSPPGIAFHGVTFAYDKNRDVLRGLDFTLAPGEAAGLIGPSGAGKTTLLHLLPRFFDPVAGSIELGGVDIRQLALKDLRRNIALVLQEPIILPGTVAENIACARPDASALEIAAAAEAANAAGFIDRLPEKFSTRIGEGGVRLSAGERQRISLARAFLKNAPILLLDEPTSALDAESEALIAESLGRLLKDRAALLVAHRPATLAHLSRILVLQNGQLVENGTPDDLRRANGYYARVIAPAR